MFSKKANYLHPLDTSSAMEACRTELPGRFAREAWEGHGPNILIYIYIYTRIRINI